MDIIFNIGLPLSLIFLAMLTGTLLEKKHFASIREREHALGVIPTLSGKHYPSNRPVVDSRLVQGAVVVSIDHFKRLLAGLRLIFGGELKSYCSLLDRARREAILRMKAQYPDADLIVNLRVETSSISKGQAKAIGSTEVVAYGTAIKFAATQT